MSFLCRPSLLFVTALALCSQAAPPTLPFGFAPPELTLSDFGTRNLQLGDFDHDGTLDLAVLNPGSGRVDLYLQREEEQKDAAPILHRERWQPQLSHPRFQRESLLLQHEPMAMRSGDFNRDGVDDLAIVNDQDRVEIYQGPMTSGWEPADSIEVPTVSGEPGTLIWDPEDQILVLLGERSLSEIRWSPKGKQYHSLQLANLPQGERRSRLLLLDVDANGQKDILYQSGTSSFNLAVHLRGKSGSTLLLRPNMEPEAARFVPHPANPSALLALHRKSPTLLEFAFTAGKPKGAPQLQVECIPLGTRQTPDTTWADVNRDGRDDLLVLEKGRQELSWFQSEVGGAMTSRPSLPLPVSPGWILPGTWLDSVPTPHFLLHDPESGYLGITWYEKDRFQLPKTIGNDEKILMAARWPSPGNESDRVLGILRDGNNAYQAVVWTLNGTSSTLEEQQRVELKGLTRNPSDLHLLPADGDRPELFFVSNPLGAALILEVADNGSLKQVEPAKGFSSKLVERLKSQNVQSLPPDIFATPWVLFKGTTVQFLRMGENGNLQVVDQLNLRDRGDAVAILPLDQDAARVAVYDRAQNRFELHGRDETGIYRYETSMQVPPFQFQSARLFRHKNTGEMTLRMQGRTQSMIIRPTAPRLITTSSRLYESDLPNTRPTTLVVGDFNGDQQDDLVIIDPVAKHTLEILEKQEDSWSSKMHFPLFETSPGASGRRGGVQEPREVIAADVNGDGLDDLVMLIHDRILLYLQDPVPEAP